MSINLECLYYEIKKHIDKVDFSKLWRGFESLKFALYTDNECFFDGKYIPKTDEFLGNTSICYNNEVIAIWNVMEQADSIVLASKMIHEMFHGFQRINNESRFPNEMDALYQYKYDDVNLSLKLEENVIISELLDNFEFDKFQKLLKIRKFRASNYSYEYHYETCVEQIEGAAQFVELCALKQLSYDTYLDKLNKLKSRITINGNLLPVRIISYDVGALLLLILNENGIEYQSDFVNTPFSEYLIANMSECQLNVELSMGATINSYYENADLIISKAIESNDVVNKGLFDLLGVNVYNAIYRNGFIISRYFVMYGDKNCPKVEYGDFVIETPEYMKVSKIYRI